MRTNLARLTKTTFFAMGLAVSGGLMPGEAAGQGSDPFYSGRQIRVVVASGPGGGFDTYARLLARHLGEFVPGAPSFVVQNMAGAGGLRAANFIAKLAPKDGLTIGALHPGTVKTPLMGAKGADFDPTQFGWIGSLNSEVMVCVSSRGSGVETLKDVMTKELIVGGAGITNDSALIPVALNNLLGTRFKLVPGYPDGPSILLAMQRQEVAGRCGWSWSSIVVQHPEWIKDRSINVLLQLPSRHPDLKDVPLVTDYAADESAKRAIQFLFGHLVMSRAYALPPGVPSERLETLRTGFDRMVRDPGVAAEFSRIKQELSPISGKEIQAVVKSFYDIPKDVLQTAMKAIEIAP
jgi:tripartite-type tricarboxylate transporter receptor subunit TctC